MTPEQQLRAALGWLPKTTRIVFEKDWNSPRIAGRGTWAPKFVMLHHTAGSSSLKPLLNTAWPPVRGSHVLIDRDGTVRVLASSKTYHAGKGGPRWGVPAGAMNAYAWGIEIEDLGKAQTMTEAQIESAARLSRGLLEAMGKDLDALIQHKEWNPSGKVDTRYPTSFWRDRVNTVTKPQEVAQMTAPRYGRTLAKWPVGDSVMHKTPLRPLSKQQTVTAGKPFTIAVIDTPKGGKFHHSLQVRMPADSTVVAEVELVRLSWPGLAKEDSTGHNAVEPARKLFGAWRRWRTPIQHPIDGGGPVAYRILLSGTGTHRMRFVAKATRVS